MARSWRSTCAILSWVLLFMATSNFIFGAHAQNADEADEWLAAHNDARTEEGVGLTPFVWNAAAYEFALSWAQTVAATTNCFSHSGTSDYGENIYWSSDLSTTPTMVVADGWMSEKQYYDYASNTCSAPNPPGTCLHYSQVVWGDTTGVGCASVECASGDGKFFICDYYPPGNVNDGRPY